MVIFQNRLLDLDAQKICEKHKHGPGSFLKNVTRRMTSWPGGQLLRRIEEPMRKFATNEAIMRLLEQTRGEDLQHRLQKAPVAFETLWLQAWTKSIETSKAGLQATLIVRHPETGNLLVNFDREISQLMREAKYLQRMGIEVPESAKMVLLQEEKFKRYYNQLSHALKEYDRVTSAIVPVAKPLLGPHLDDLEKKLAPGMYILTWTSMNIDGYLMHVHTSLSGLLEELIGKMNDAIDNRIEANLKLVAKTKFVDLPDDQSFTVEEFQTTQARFIKQQTDELVVKNVEIERGTTSLRDDARLPSDNPEVELEDVAVDEFTHHYAKLMYQAIHRDKRGFGDDEEAPRSRSSGGFLFVERPFFDVDVELTVPTVTMIRCSTPSRRR